MVHSSGSRVTSKVTLAKVVDDEVEDEHWSGSAEQCERLPREQRVHAAEQKARHDAFHRSLQSTRQQARLLSKDTPFWIYKYSRKLIYSTSYITYFVIRV